jgi:exodeoxyribonuclease V alpha subunit
VSTVLLPSGAEALAPFVDAGVLAAADVHVASALTRLADDHHPLTLLGVAMAVRAPRLGHVGCDLATVGTTVTAAGDDPAGAELRWPDPDEWRAHLAASPLVTVADPAPMPGRPLVLDAGLLYLERHWQQERRIASHLLTRASAAGVPAAWPLPSGVLDDLLDGLTDDAQRAAVELGRSGRVLVIAGGPGTGKTTTVARLLAGLGAGGPAGGSPHRIALAAPTGKAASRMNEAVAAAAARLPGALGGVLAAVPPATTIHRLLGVVPGGGFRHGAGHPLPHRVVVVDETSMISVSLMASLLDAVHPDALLVLVGDPDQLASVEAGAVLGDVVGPAAHASEVPARHPQPLTSRIVVLRTSYRFGETTTGGPAGRRGPSGRCRHRRRGAARRRGGSPVARAPRCARGPRSRWSPRPASPVGRARCGGCEARRRPGRGGRARRAAGAVRPPPRAFRGQRLERAAGRVAGRHPRPRRPPGVVPRPAGARHRQRPPQRPLER